MVRDAPSQWQHWKWFRAAHARTLGWGVLALFAYAIVFLQEDPDNDYIGLVGARPDAIPGGIVFLIVSLVGWVGWFATVGWLRHEYPREPDTAGAGTRFGISEFWSDAVRWATLLVAVAVLTFALIDDTANAPA
jgi:hypothetical protein